MIKRTLPKWALILAVALFMSAAPIRINPPHMSVESPIAAAGYSDAGKR